MEGGHEEGKEPDQLHGSNGRGREQRLTLSGTVLSLSSKTLELLK